MNRREALGRVALILGGSIVGAEAFLTGCKPSKKEGLFGADDVIMLDEVGETILPATPDSPGAKEAKIGEFMKLIVTDCYTEDEQHAFTNGITELNAASNKKYSKDFVELTPENKTALLTELDKEARDFNTSKKPEEPKHYFSMIKELTIWGYFTSEPGATKALRYVAVPGRYEGCIPYTKGEKAWALS